jgi:hypothetical protein
MTEILWRLPASGDGVQVVVVLPDMSGVGDQVVVLEAVVVLPVAMSGLGVADEVSGDGEDVVVVVGSVPAKSTQGKERGSVVWRDTKATAYKRRRAQVDGGTCAR